MAKTTKNNNNDNLMGEIAQRVNTDEVDDVPALLQEIKNETDSTDSTEFISPCGPESNELKTTNPAMIARVNFDKGFIAAQKSAIIHNTITLAAKLLDYNSRLKEPDAPFKTMKEVYSFMGVKPTYAKSIMKCYNTLKQDLLSTLLMANINAKLLYKLEPGDVELKEGGKLRIGAITVDPLEAGKDVVQKLINDVIAEKKEREKELILKDSVIQSLRDENSSIKAKLIDTTLELDAVKKQFQAQCQEIQNEFNTVTTRFNNVVSKALNTDNPDDSLIPVAVSTIQYMISYLNQLQTQIQSKDTVKATFISPEEALKPENLK